MTVGATKMPENIWIEMDLWSAICFSVCTVGNTSLGRYGLAENRVQEQQKGLISAAFYFCGQMRRNMVE